MLSAMYQVISTLLGLCCRTSDNLNETEVVHNATRGRGEAQRIPVIYHFSRFNWVNNMATADNCERGQRVSFTTAAVAAVVQ